jgi:hypothetical protein
MSAHTPDDSSLSVSYQSVEDCLQFDAIDNRPVDVEVHSEVLDLRKV